MLFYVPAHVKMDPKGCTSLLTKKVPN